MTPWPHISVKNKTDVLQERLHAGSEGGAGFTSRGSRSTGGRASRTALTKTSCVKGGTHSALPQNAMECGKTGDWLRNSVKQHSVPMRDLPRCATSLHSAAHVRKSFGHAVRSFVRQEHAGVK